MIAYQLERLACRSTGDGDHGDTDDMAMTGQRTGPSRVWYWVAGAAMVASVVWLAVGIFFGFRSFSEQVEGFQRVPVPGQAEVSFEEPGGYTVYFEGLGAGDEQITIPSLSVSLAPVGGGAEVPVHPYGGSATYSVGARSGRAVGTFRIDAPGRFLIRTQGNPEGGQAEVAVGSSIAPTIGRTLGLTIPAVLVLFFGGAALAVVVAARRHQARGPRPALAPWTQEAVPAGWFADPSRRHELRYWDGQRWTERVSDRGSQAVDPM
jgi:Protein of unknown function (DUF2510)